MTTLPRPLLRYLIEVRKLLDTRSALAVLLASLAAAVLAISLLVVTQPEAVSVAGLAQNSVGLVAYVLPLLAILAVTSEWRQRTVLGTYTLDPDRTAVLLAKAAALLSVVCVVAVVVLAASCATVAALGGALPAPTDLLVMLGWLVLGMAGIALIGYGIAAAVLNAPLAITLYLVAPPLLPQLATQIAALAPAAPYLDIHGPLLGLVRGSLPEHPSGFAVAGLLWLVAPVVVGFVRNARSDVG